MISAAIYVLALVESVMLPHAWVRVCMSRVVGHSQRFYWTSQTQAREDRGAERRGPYKTRCRLLAAEHKGGGSALTPFLHLFLPRPSSLHPRLLCFLPIVNSFVWISGNSWGETEIPWNVCLRLMGEWVRWSTIGVKLTSSMRLSSSHRPISTKPRCFEFCKAN